jgi:signal transduction histidine kinase
MRERAEELGGSLEIRSDGGATTVTATLPLPAVSAQARALASPLQAPHGRAGAAG